MNNKNLKLRKVPVDVVLSILTQLYEQGVDFVDITGNMGEESDSILFSINESYMSEDIEGSINDLEINDFKEIKKVVEENPSLALTDEDINNLI